MLISKLKKIFKFLCKHRWKSSGFSYVICKECGKKKYNPKLATELITERINKMQNMGIWKEEDVRKARKNYNP